MSTMSVGRVLGDQCYSISEVKLPGDVPQESLLPPSSFNCYIVMVRTRPLTIVIKLGVVHLPRGC
jgi:hypothetical protein